MSTKLGAIQSSTEVLRLKDDRPGRSIAAKPCLSILSGHQRQHHHTVRLSGCECRRNRDNLWEAENDSAMLRFWLHPRLLISHQA